MRYFVPDDDSWSEVSDAPPPPSLQFDPEAPSVSIVGPDETAVELSGAPVDPDADTIHTLTVVDPSAPTAEPLCAVYVQGQTLDLEDQRSPNAPDALDHLRSALDEILIPVYVDDGVTEATDAIDGWVVLQTVQHDDGPDAPPTYVRVALFEKGALQMEAEHGAL